MNIKYKLSVQFTLLVLVILIFFSFLVYYFSNSSQKSEFRHNLLDMARNTAILLIDVEEVDSTLLNKIHKTTKSLDHEEIAIYNSRDVLIYSNQIKYLSDYKLTNVPASQNPYYFKVKEKDGILYHHRAKGQSYCVYVLAYDAFKAENQQRLKKILVWSSVTSLFLSVSVSYLFSKMALMPITHIVQEIQQINLAKLFKRLDEGSGKDEIEQLSVNFNKLLSELELAFKSQEEFISNASHELRTPLAVMIARADYLLSRDRSNPEYKHQLAELRENMRNLNALLNNLLEMAHINRENEMELSSTRMDEVIFNSIHSVKQKYAGRRIIPRIEFSDNENDFVILGNQGFLEIAFRNLIDNACKFSKGDVEVEITHIKENLTVKVIDYGIGIPGNETENIFNPFSRGANANYFGGYGIGLSIVRKIINLHHAEITVTSRENEPTVFEITFKKTVC